jgi:hypothetical protein
MRSAPSAVVVALLLTGLSTAGCTTYYQVTDPASGRLYYADDLKRSKDGTVQFKDLKSGADVTLRSSEVREVSSDEVKKATGQ